LICTCDTAAACSCTLREENELGASFPLFPGDRWFGVREAFEAAWKVPVDGRTAAKTTWEIYDNWTAQIITMRATRHLEVF